MGGDKVVTLCFRFLGATSGTLPWISQGLGDRQRRRWTRRQQGEGQEKVRVEAGRGAGRGGGLQTPARTKSLVNDRDRDVCLRDREQREKRERRMGDMGAQMGEEGNVGSVG